MTAPTLAPAVAAGLRKIATSDLRILRDVDLDAGRRILSEAVAAGFESYRAILDRVNAEIGRRAVYVAHIDGFTTSAALLSHMSNNSRRPCPICRPA